jgi:hypothetical protein
LPSLSSAFSYSHISTVSLFGIAEKPLVELYNP